MTKSRLDARPPVELVDAKERPEVIAKELPDLSAKELPDPLAAAGGAVYATQGGLTDAQSLDAKSPEPEKVFAAPEPKNSCGGSFATSPSCSDDPKNKSLIQKIICQGQANPVDSICLGLLTAATVPAVVLQTAKWVNCGKPSKGALYAFGSLGLWGVEVARSINNIHVDEKKL